MLGPSYPSHLTLPLSNAFASWENELAFAPSLPGEGREEWSRERAQERMAGSSEEGLDNEKLEQYQKQQLALQVRVQRQELSATRAQVQQLQTDRQAAENALSSAAR